jgi:hypothetical protein
MRLLYGTNSMTFSDPKSNIIASSLNYLIPKMYASYFYNLESQLSGDANATTKFINSMAASGAGLIAGVTIGEHGTSLIPQESGQAKNTRAFDDPRANVIKRSFDGHINKEVFSIDVDKMIVLLKIAVAA